MSVLLNGAAWWLRRYLYMRGGPQIQPQLIMMGGD